MKKFDKNKPTFKYKINVGGLSTLKAKELVKEIINDYESDEYNMFFIPISEGQSDIESLDVNYKFSDIDIEEYVRCNNDILYFVSKLSRDGKKITLRDYQIDMINHYKDNDKSIFVNSRQVGFILVLSIIQLHELLFNRNKKIHLISDKRDTSNEYRNLIVELYDSVPVYLEKMIGDNNRQLIFNNGSYIKFDVYRKGVDYSNIDDLVMTEYALGPFSEEVFNDSIDVKKKVIISTPNGHNHFYKLVSDSERGVNDYSTLRTYWFQVPNRDDEWVKKTIQMIGGLDNFDSEFNLSFNQIK